jgi:glycosyltransferase involved in cell wall biosynthesis
VGEGALPASAAVLLGGTDPRPFLERSALEREDDGLVRLLYCGRLIHDKGVHTAIKALGRLRAEGSLDRLRLTVLGSGHPEYEERLRAMIGDLGLGGAVELVPQAPREEIPNWLGRADIFLFTSIWPEPMARSVMEAMAAGLLVIGSEVGGQTEMLRHGENALTFQAEDAATLAQRIRQAAGDRAQRRALALAGQRMVLEKFTLDRMTGDIEALLESVAGGAGAAHR